jgi:glycogen debranching enzyme
VCPTGNSIIETVEMHAGFECVDIAAYTWEALTYLAGMAEAVGDTAITVGLTKKADALAARLREEWWLEDEGLFADLRASLNEVEGKLSHLENVAAEQSWMLQGQRHVQTARRLFEPYLARYADQPRDIDLPWLLRHWVVLCPVEVGVATRQQAERALMRLQSPEFCSEWGMVLHPERDDVMSINTGLLALAAARYGKVNDALNIVKKLTNAFSYLTPGAISEALPGKWCFLQLWSNVGIVAPVVECFLGIEPRAADRLLRVVPQLPADWDRAEVKRLRVGDTSFDVSVARGGDAYSIHVRCDDPAARLELGIVLPESKSVKSMTLNGKPMEWMTQETNRGRCAVCATRGNAELRVHF